MDGIRVENINTCMIVNITPTSFIFIYLQSAVHPPPLYNYTAIFVICSIIKPDNIRIIEAVKTG